MYSIVASTNIVKINYESLTVPIKLDKNKNTQKTRSQLGFTALGTESFIKFLFMSSSRF